MENKEEKKQGLRYNSGKVKHDLLEPFAINELAKVFTKGAEKYEPNNWLRGMPWTTVLASLKRHLNAFEKGEDFDPETLCYHISHVAWNAMALTSYYKFCPEFDDRLHVTMPKKRIALDIDEVIADWVGHWTKHHGQEVTPEFWNFDKDIKSKFDVLKDDYNFWLSIPPKIDPKELPFEPIAYVTSRIIPTEITEQWIQNNGFPTMPVYTVGHNESKVEVLKKIGADWFVDDRYENFVDLNKNGICCFLMDAPHNRRYDVGARRIYSLKDLIK